MKQKVSSDREVVTNVGEAALHALKWRYLGTLLQGGLQFAIGVTLARILSPEDFGIMGMALIATAFASLVADCGFGAAIIQYPNLTGRHVRAALTGTMLMSIVLASVLWLLAPTITRLFGQDTLTPILRVIGISLVFSGMSVTVVSLLRRSLQFRSLTIIESFSYIISFGAVGISMAMLGYGAWSLVIANVFQSCCLLSLAVYFAKQRFWPYFGLQEFRDLFQVASAEVLNNVVNFIAENLQFLVVGKWLGAFALGMYNRSSNTMDLPVRYFSFALSNVMFPVYAQIQRDIPRLGSAFLRTASFAALITVPVFFAMASVPGIVIGGLFGDQWKAAAEVFQVLCLAGPFLAMMRVFGAVSHAMGKVFNECNRQVVYLGIVSIGVWLFLPFGLKGVALAVAIATFIRYLLLAQLSLKLVGVSWARFLAAQLPGYLLGIVTSASAYLVSSVGETAGMSDVFQLLMIVPTCALSLTLGLYLFPSSWFEGLHWIRERFGMRIPDRIRDILIAKIYSL